MISERSAIRWDDDGEPVPAALVSDLDGMRSLLIEAEHWNCEGWVMRPPPGSSRHEVVPFTFANGFPTYMTFPAVWEAAADFDDTRIEVITPDGRHGWFGWNRTDVVVPEPISTAVGEMFGAPLPDVMDEARPISFTGPTGWMVTARLDVDKRGTVVELYAMHRMTNDRHVTIDEAGTVEHLPALRDYFGVAADEDRDQRWHDEQDRADALRAWLERRGLM